MEPTIPERWSIFSALHDAMKEKALNKLRFAKCDECGLLTPYRLKHVEGNTVKCKKCGTLIQLNVESFALF